MNKRNLVEDLVICDAATPGPWIWWGYGESIGDGIRSINQKILMADDNKLVIVNKENINLMVEARQGWPEAIKRAISAEEEVERLKGQLQDALNTLDWYATACHWFAGEFDGEGKFKTMVSSDVGKRARDAIQRIQGDKGEVTES
ncbi:hypothetical protein MH117_04945 [Paenibacillus sp. ACRRX]|uniref:hypothetical protein n=1 Tax=Paenibacillus sp. ACRRX TaxID=2918206 RepID=UPI001EF73F43|nr:hypothetical protein [Paenibacillus sp. ACRRX]MCG7406757.1 hypothetical protein [Paenibacillus sp. ACRRX]